MKVFEGLHGFFWQSQTANNCNTYLVEGERRVLIDPGHRALFGHVEKGLSDIGLRLDDIDVVIGTHGHPDHLEAIELLRGTGAKFGLHREEWRWLSDVGRQMAAALGMDIDAFEPDFFLGAGELCIGDLKFSVHHTPGHSPGSICLYWPQNEALFSGDVLFDRGIGRTDLPGGDGAALKTSIARLAGLRTSWLLPGHGGFIEGAADVERNFERVENSYFALI